MSDFRLVYRKSGSIPNENYIRKHGHNLIGLYKSCYEIAENRDIRFRFLNSLETDVQQKMLSILNSFAESAGRYHNINILTNANIKEDCMKRWKIEIDDVLYNECVSVKKKRKIEENARMIADIGERFTLVEYISEEGEVMNNIKEASEQTGIWEAVAPYRQLYMLQIIRFFVEILIALCYEAMKVKDKGKIDIPYLSEVFGLFYNSDAYFRSRKTWDKI